MIEKTGQYKESNSGEKWNEQFANDAYGILPYRCCTSKVMFIQVSDSASCVCTKACKMGIRTILAKMDEF